MDVNLISFWIGVASSLVAIIVLWAFGKGIGKLSRWHAARVYEGISFEGKWTLDTSGRPADDEWQHAETLELVQSGNRVSGTLALTPMESSDRPAHSMKVKGTAINRMLSLKISSVARDALSNCVALVEAQRGGDRLVGGAVFYDADSEQIVATDVVYNKS